MLGGQLISRNLEARHDLATTQGARFYSGYGDETATMRREFLIFADTICGDQAQCAKAVAMACQTFNLFSQTFDKFLLQKFYSVELDSCDRQLCGPASRIIA